MQKKHLWLLLAVAAGIVLGFWWSRRSSHPESAPIAPPVVTHTVPAPAPAAPLQPPAPARTEFPAPVVAEPKVAPERIVPAAPIPVAPEPVVPVQREVAIQEQKTIDFSNGKAVIKDSTKDKAIIDSAVKEMDAAAKDITFSPTAPAADKAPQK